MKFTDYYSILSVASNATGAEIKSAYRALARQLHPDVNKSQTATNEMQGLNEAYLILSDAETKQLYDREYQAYRAWVSESTQPTAESEYCFDDETLRDRVNKAAKKARSLGRQIIDDGKDLLCVAGKETAKSVMIYGVGMSLMFLLLVSMARCHR